MNELLQANGLTKVAEAAVPVTGLKGPLEEGWQNEVTAFAGQIMSTARAFITSKSVTFSSAVHELLVNRNPVINVLARR